jgi:hypothetical protein
MTARLEQGINNVVGDGFWGTEWPTRTIKEPIDAMSFEPIDPFVAGLAANAVSTADLSHWVKLPAAIGDEVDFLFHG